MVAGWQAGRLLVVVVVVWGHSGSVLWDKVFVSVLVKTVLLLCGVRNHCGIELLSINELVFTRDGLGEFLPAQSPERLPTLQSIRVACDPS